MAYACPEFYQGFTVATCNVTLLVTLKDAKHERKWTCTCKRFTWILTTPKGGTPGTAIGGFVGIVGGTVDST